MARKTADEAAKTKAAIIAAAKKLFGKQGYAATTTSQIAMAAGVTEGAFFHHFKDKKALLAEVVRQLQKAYDRQVSLAAFAGIDPMDQFLRGSREALRISQRREYLQIVLLDSPAVLGREEWKRIDAVLALATLEPSLRAVASPRTVDDRDLRPFALLVLGLLNEGCYALARGDTLASDDAIIDLLEMTVIDWLARLDAMAKVPRSKVKFETG
jgi:AcrR family transcriptional regulator